MKRPPRRRDPARNARELVVTAIGVGVLLALVAVASRAGRGGGADEAGPLLPSGALAYVYASIVVGGAFVLPFLVYAYTREVPYAKAERRRIRLLPLWIAVVAVLAVAVRGRLGDDFGDVLERLSIPSLGRLGGGGEGDGAEAPATQLAPIVLVYSLLALAVAAYVVVRTLRRRGNRLPPLVQELAAALEETLAELEAEPDARRAIIVAYARMESALERSGVPRHEWEAPLEYLARVLLELDVRPEPVRTLTELFERAKFSNHPLGTSLKDRAIAALTDVRSDLAVLAA